MVIYSPHISRLSPQNYDQNRNLLCSVFKVVRLGMFEVHSHDLVRALVKRAEGLLQKLVTHMLQGHQEFNSKWVTDRFPKHLVSNLLVIHVTDL